MIKGIMKSVIVIKHDPQGNEIWHYSGKILREFAYGVLIEAYFNRKGKFPFHGVTLVEGDRFLELYYWEEWYNIFEIYSGLDGTFKGWYCNISRPAMIVDDIITYEDLALDLLVYPDGRQLVLDEDEFAKLQIDEQTRQGALQGLEKLKRLFSDGRRFKIKDLLFGTGNISALGLD